MSGFRSHVAVAVLAVALWGCNSPNSLLPSLGLGGNGESAPASGSGAAGANRPPALTPASFTPAPAGTATGTFVGKKVEQHRAELQRLQGNSVTRSQALQAIRTSTAANAQAYFATVGAINARLQVGTTPGNPILVGQWNQAQAQLDRMHEDIARLNRLSTEVSGDAAFAGFLIESIRATFGLSGAVDEDHRALAQIEDETNRTVVAIDRLLNEVSDDLARQQAYVAGERANLTTLALAIRNGELFGQSLTNRSFVSGMPAGPSPTPVLPSTMGPAADDGRRPLVVIRFDRANVAFEQPLYAAVSRALERRPSARFDLVAVTPSRSTGAQGAFGTTAAKRNAEQVLRALNQMGLPASRVQLQAQTSGAASAPEVHLFVR